MIQPSVFGQVIIITVYLPILTFTGVEGKMFEPMALTVIIALVAAFVLSLTFVPAMVAIFVTGKVQEKENSLIRGAKRLYEPLLRGALRRHWLRHLVAPWRSFSVALFLFTRLGQEFVPTLDEKDVAMHAMRIPSTGSDASRQRCSCRSSELSGACPKWRSCFPRPARRKWRLIQCRHMFRTPSSS